MHTENWRRLAIQHLPQFSELVQTASSEVDLWQLLKEVVADCGTDSASLKRASPIFAYAWWCVAHSQDPDRESAARTYFYEDLPVYSDTQDKITPFLDMHQYRTLRPSLSARIDDHEMSRLFATFETSLANGRDT